LLRTGNPDPYNQRCHSSADHPASPRLGRARRSAGRRRDRAGFGRPVAPRHGDLHLLMLLSAAMCLSHLPALQRDLRALLLQVHAVPDLLPLQRHLRSLLLQADAVSLRPARAGVRLLHAGLLWLGPLMVG
jgi:hypothetical protein